MTINALTGLCPKPILKPGGLQVGTVIITGISRGIGLGLAARYLERGDTVAGTVRAANAAVADLQRTYGAKLFVATTDVTDAGALDQAARSVRERFSAADVLVCNAAINPGSASQTTEVGDLSDEDLSATLNVNVTGVQRTIRAFRPLLVAAGGARIAVISSGAGSIAGTAGGAMIPYCVSKAAVNMLTRRLSFLLAGDGIDVFAISPGWVKTDMGGPGAQITVQESTNLIVQRIAEHGPDDPPFINHTGGPLDW